MEKIRYDLYSIIHSQVNKTAKIGLVKELMINRGHEISDILETISGESTNGLLIDVGSLEYKLSKVAENTLSLQNHFKDAEERKEELINKQIQSTIDTNASVRKTNESITDTNKNLKRASWTTVGISVLTLIVVTIDALKEDSVVQLKEPILKVHRQLDTLIKYQKQNRSYSPIYPADSLGNKN